MSCVYGCILTAVGICDICGARDASFRSDDGQKTQSQKLKKVENLKNMTVNIGYVGAESLQTVDVHGKHQDRSSMSVIFNWACTDIGFGQLYLKQDFQTGDLIKVDTECMDPEFIRAIFLSLAEKVIKCDEDQKENQEYSDE